MRGVVVLCLVACLSFATPALAVKFSGVEVPDTLQAGGDSLLLNGVGMREKFFLNLYVGALYLQKKSSDAKAIVEADAPMAITIHITSNMITEKRMADATEEGFQSTAGDKIKQFQKDVDAFIKVFSVDIKVDDNYDLIYLPGKGVNVVKNGKQVLNVPGLPFKQALFGIWIGDKATVNKGLQKGMLGLKK